MILTILTGDNIKLLKQYPDNYFDSVVTDCPYGLGKEPDALKLLQDWIDHGYHEIKGKGFMGKSWDAFVPQPLFWKEVFRVLKPGGYVLAFFGTRTYDWGTMGIRLAGFEIRDMICWHYGSGFPKSLDVSKAIDKSAGAERLKVSRKRVDSKKTGMSTGIFMNGSDNVNLAYDNSGITLDAIKYKGFGTALKPATEPICVARKQLEGTVVENILKYGTGGINIDKCRIKIDENDKNHRKSSTDFDFDKKRFFGLSGRPVENLDLNGRFPANVIFDPFMGAVLDEQTGVLTSGKPVGKCKAQNNIYGEYATGQDITGFGDSGGASRFFYCAKASQEERNLCFHDFETQKVNDGREVDCDNAFQREKNERTNFHPTVKPIALMRYLQRLVTPKGGICLDPFAGSGTSGCAAYFEDIGEMVLMEMDETYIPIIEARTKYWSVERNRINYLDEIKKQKQEAVESQFKLAL